MVNKDVYNNGYIVYFSLRMRKKATFPLPFVSCFSVSLLWLEQFTSQFWSGLGIHLQSPGLLQLGSRHRGQFVSTTAVSTQCSSQARTCPFCGKLTARRVEFKL